MSEHALIELAEYLNAHFNSDVKFSPSGVDRKKHARVFELCCAIELDATPWDKLSIDMFNNCSDEVKSFMSTGRKPRDYGIDCVKITNSTITSTIQCKWYQPGGTVCWRDISTFFALSFTLHVEDMILVTSENVKIVKLFRALPINHIVMTDSKINQICERALTTSASELTAALIVGRKPRINKCRFIFAFIAAIGIAALIVICINPFKH